MDISFNLNFLYLTFLPLIIGCSKKQNSDAIGFPVEQAIGVLNQFEEICDNYTDWKLESDDHKLTVYTVQDSIPEYPSMCLVLYDNGKQTVAVSEYAWRKKYHIKPDEVCPLFSNGHRRLYTINNYLHPESPTYVLVTQDFVEDKLSHVTGQENYDEMCVYAHAYTIQNGQLQPKEIFHYNGMCSYITDSDTTMWVEWLNDIPDVWPAKYDKQTRTLEISTLKTYSVMHSVMLYRKRWSYDDKTGFRLNRDYEEFGYKIGEIYPYIVAMSELFSKYKIQINYDGCLYYQYMSWPSDSTWSAEPSTFITGGVRDDKESSIIFKSKDNYEYVVYFDSHPEGLWPSISAIEIRQGGKIIYNDNIGF